MTDNTIFLLWCWYNPLPEKVGGITITGTSYTTLRGAYESEEEANYYCDGLNKKNKSKSVKYYVDKFYCNTTFYFIDANGNCLVPEYKPKK